MNLMEVLGAFCVGLAVVFFVRLGLNALEKTSVKVFIGITAAVIGGGALLLVAAIRNNATVWPDAYWAYPVGLAVGISVSKLLWKKREESGEEFKFRLGMVALMAGAVVLLAFPQLLPVLLPRELRELEPTKVVGEIVRALGEALVIATVLALTVDLYIKRRTYQEISLDVFKFLIGYGLPDEFKDRIREIVTNSELVRRDSSVTWTLRPVVGEQNRFQLDYKVSYQLQNLSPRRVEYQFKTAKSPSEDQETKLTRLWGKFPAAEYEYAGDRLQHAPVETEPSGKSWIKGDKVWVDAENVQHGLSFKAGADYVSTLQRQFDYHVFAYPTLGATVIVEHPKELRVSLSPTVEGRPDVDPIGEGRVRTTWEYRRLFFTSDAIFVRWGAEEGASQDRGGGI